MWWWLLNRNKKLHLPSLLGASYFGPGHWTPLCCGCVVRESAHTLDSHTHALQYSHTRCCRARCSVMLSSRGWRIRGGRRRRWRRSRGAGGGPEQQQERAARAAKRGEHTWWVRIFRISLGLCRCCSCWSTFLNVALISWEFVSQLHAEFYKLSCSVCIYSQRPWTDFFMSQPSSFLF